MTKKYKICDLEEDKQTKKMLTYLAEPRKYAEIAVHMGFAYSTVGQKLAILEVKGYVKKVKSMGGKVFYKLNDKVLVI